MPPGHFAPHKLLSAVPTSLLNSRLIQVSTRLIHTAPLWNPNLIFFSQTLLRFSSISGKKQLLKPRALMSHYTAPGKTYRLYWQNIYKQMSHPRLTELATCANDHNLSSGLWQCKPLCWPGAWPWPLIFHIVARKIFSNLEKFVLLLKSLHWFNVKSKGITMTYSALNVGSA